jgi:hypothetical protein
VVKLPRQRVAARSATEVGKPFAIGQRVMKEWLAVPESESARWLPLAHEALRFAGGRSPAHS